MDLLAARKAALLLVDALLPATAAPVTPVTPGPVTPTVPPVPVTPVTPVTPTIPGSVLSPVPLSYGVRNDRNPQIKPALPHLGSSDFIFTDPAFGSRLLRVTDENTRTDRLGASFRVQSSAHGTSINVDGTKMFVVSTDGAIIPFAVDAPNLRVSRLPQIVSQVEPQFSRIVPETVYGNGGPNNHTIYALNINTGARITLIDLDTVGMTPDTYIGGILVGGNPEFLVAVYGGAMIDAHYKILWRAVDGSKAKTLDTMAKFNWHIHAMQIDRYGRYVFIYPADADRSATKTPGGAFTIAQVYLWDTTTDVVSPLWLHPAGHDSAGYGVWVNQDCCAASSWDAGQWQFRSLGFPDAARDLIPTILTPQEVYLADHTSWNNAQPDRLVPILSSTYRFGPAIGTPPRAWSDEIIAIATDGTGTVWRFCHHRTDIRQDGNPALIDFWYEPLVSIAPNGRWAVFSSNWEKSLGMDSVDGHHRQDVFLVELK